jgi:lectin-like protein
VFGPDAPPLSASDGGNMNMTGGSSGAAPVGVAGTGGAGAPHAGGGTATAGGPPDHPAAGAGNPPDPDPDPAAAGAAGADNAAGGSGQPPGPLCGNGVIESGEQCDGGSDHDGCDAECQVVCSHYGTGALQSDDHHCYKGFDQNDFADARQDCIERGGHLATIASAAENKLISEFVNESKFVGGFEDVALNSEGTGSYAWITGEAFDYTNWAEGEPDRAVSRCAMATSGSSRCYEHCVAMIRGGTWTDQRCDRADGYVCEWEPPGTK